jgi:hypothetical protein
MMRKADPANAREPRAHTATAEELAQHAEFLGQIKDPIWQS